MFTCQSYRFFVPSLQYGRLRCSRVSLLCRARGVRCSGASYRCCHPVLCAYLVLFLAKAADLCDSVRLIVGGVAVPVSGTRVFKSKEPRGTRVDEALVAGTLGGGKPLHSSTPPSLVRSAIGLGRRSELTGVWLTKVPYITATKRNIRRAKMAHTPYSDWLTSTGFDTPEPKLMHLTN